MFHRSPRLLLRPVWPEDWQAIHRGIADEGVVRNLARAPWPYSEADAREFAARPADPLLPSFLVTRAADGVVIGSAGLGVAPSEGRAANDSGILADGPAELGYWIARAHWGRGYATEAGAAVIAVLITRKYLRNRVRDALGLMEQDGIPRWKGRLKLAWFLWGNPGMMRRMFGEWAAILLPGFHPWQHDDRALIGKGDSPYADAVMPAE